MTNLSLAQAKRGKKDEFYTQLRDIENELRHYKHHFRGKTVYCNCDDPRVSKFFFYFSCQFEYFGLKRLIATCYKNNNPDLFSQHNSEKAVYLEYFGDQDGNRVPDKHEIAVKELEGDGDFRSAECLKLLKQADIVVTNPPFSLFRQYVDQLMEYEKLFLIIGHQNAITYKELFPLMKGNKIWLGVHNPREFAIPEHYPLTSKSYRIDKHGTRILKANGVKWFTNLSHQKRKEKMILYRNYSPQQYPHYDNYDAIEVSKTKDIPEDWAGAMGVPVTFMDKYNPDQFEIIGITDRSNRSGLRTKKYTRLDDPNYSSLNRRGAIKVAGRLKPTYAVFSYVTKMLEKDEQIIQKSKGFFSQEAIQAGKSSIKGL